MQNDEVALQIDFSSTGQENRRRDLGGVIHEKTSL